MNAYRAHLRNESLNTADPAYEPPPEPEYFLKDCPRGICPWCHHGVRKNDLPDVGSSHDGPWPSSCTWDEEQTVDENRIRYAAERLEDLANERD